MRGRFENLLERLRGLFDLLLDGEHLDDVLHLNPLPVLEVFHPNREIEHLVLEHRADEAERRPAVLEPLLLVEERVAESVFFDVLFLLRREFGTDVEKE